MPLGVEQLEIFFSSEYKLSYRFKDFVKTSFRSH